MNTTCKNCNLSFRGNFCYNCGQSANTKEITPKYVLHDLQTTVLQFDKGLFFTLKELFTRPGHTIREFIEGKRIKHFRPIAFLVLLGSIYGLLLLMQTPSSQDIFTENADSQRVVKIANRIINWFTSNYAFIFLITLPLSSLASYLAFKKQGYNFFQHIVLNCYLSGARIFISILFIPFSILFGWDEGNLFSVPNILGAGFTIWALIQFFNKITFKKKIWNVILFYLLLGVIYTVIILLLLISIILLAALFGDITLQ